MDEFLADVSRVILENLSEPQARIPLPIQPSYYLLIMMSSFLLVSLNTNAIPSEPTPPEKKRTGRDNQRGESERCLCGNFIANEGAKPGIQVLVWVPYSEDMSILGIEEPTEPNTRNIPAIETLLTRPLGNIHHDRGSPPLSSATSARVPCPQLKLVPQTPLHVAKAYLTYLNIRQVKGISPPLFSLPPTAPLFTYTSRHSGTHARSEATESVE